MSTEYSDYSNYKLIGSTDKSLIDFKPLKRDVGEYVSAWFERNKDKKPSIKVIKPKDNLDLDTIANAFFSPKDGNLVSIDHVNWMIYKTIESWEGDLTEEWISFGRKLTDDNNKFSVKTMFDVEVVNGTQETPSWYNEAAKVGDAIGALYYVFAPLRLTSKYPDYNTAISKKMKEVIPAEAKHRPLSHATVATKYASWAANLTFRKLATALDMFLDRYPGHPHARLRMGTIVTRFKDSSLINSIPFFYNNLGVPGLVMSAWVWNRQAAIQMNKLLDPKNYLSEEYGYNAYGCSLELVSKSVNSITQNPELHLFIHTVCAIQGKERSKNAFFPENADTMAVVKSAFLVAGIKVLAPAEDMQYAVDGKVASAMSDDEEEDDEEEVEDKEKTEEQIYNAVMRRSPTLFDPKQWSSFLNLHKDIPIRDRLIVSSAKVTVGWTNLRDNTVGKRIQDIAKIIIEAYAGRFD